MDKKKLDKLEVILKVSERCNINCTYCYYFNGEGDDFAEKPAYITESKIDSLIKFLNQACEEYEIRNISIYLHGGEPLLLHKNRFRRMVSEFRRRLTNCNILYIAIQTNGMLIDIEWLQIFEEFQISVGISIDGPQIEHDMYRVDHQGRGTYEKAVAGIRLIQSLEKKNPLLFTGVICVINPDYSGSKIYRHFIDVLGVNKLHFLSPNLTRDGADPSLPARVSRFMLEVESEWMRDDRNDIYIRQFERAMFLFSERGAPASNIPYSSAEITVRTDGQVGPDDFIRNTLPHLFKLDFNIDTNTLAEFLDAEPIRRFVNEIAMVPDKCQRCGLQKICKSGEGLGESYLHRYSFAGRFNNASLFCNLHKETIVNLAKRAVKRGTPWEVIERSLS